MLRTRRRGWCCSAAVTLVFVWATSLEASLFVADDAYLLIWKLDEASGETIGGFSAPVADRQIVSRIGSLSRRSGLAFDGSTLYYTSGATGKIWALDAQSGAVLRSFEKPSLDITGLGASSDRVYAVAADPSRSLVYALDPFTGAELSTLEVPGAREALTFAGGRESLYVAVGALEVREVSLVDGSTVNGFAPPEVLLGLAYSSSSESLLALGESGKLYRLDPATGGVLEARDVVDTAGLPLWALGGLAADEATAAPPEEPPPAGAGGGIVEGEYLFEAQDVSGRVGEPFDMPILLTATSEIQGFQVALAHDPAALFLEGAGVDGTETSLLEPDFVSSELFPNGGTLGVIFELVEPVKGIVLPPGEDVPVARFRYGCVEVDLQERVQTEVRFVDGVLGAPLKFNLVVVGGLAESPELSPARIVCLPRELVEDGPEFMCGGPPGGDGMPTPLEAGTGERFPLCFYYTFPDTRGDLLQGLSMALSFDCRLTCIEDTFRLPPESITAIIDADFVEFNCESDPDDGDGCEMVFGVLADTLPPFGSQSLPETPDPLLLACVDMEVGLGANVGECLEIRFRDGLNGRLSVPVKNLVSLESRSFPVELVPCEVCVTEVGPELYCGAPELGADGLPELIIAEPGDEVELCFWYRSPADEMFALTEALRFDCNLECLEDTFAIAPESLPLLEGAETITLDCDNDPDDGDGCEMVLRIVGDLTPGATPVLPPTNEIMRLACVGMRISPDAPPGRCLLLEHADGIDGTGGEPVANSVTTARGEMAPLTVDCQICTPADVPRFFCGSASLGEDLLPLPTPRVPKGNSVELCFWYTSPIDEATDLDEIQGFSMALCFDCALICNEPTFRFPPGSITDIINPEFVNFHCDNDPNDGDGCEIVFGVVVEITPPFEGTTLPPSDTPLLVGCVEMMIGPAAKPGFCLPVEFCDGINGRFTVPVKNLVSVENESLQPVTEDCEVCVDFLGPKFLCGGDRLGEDLNPVPITATAGEPAEVCLWYCAPEDNARGHEQLDHLQGMSMALTFDCALTCVEDSFRLPPDSITNALGAEFVTFDCDNDPADGDGCEVVVGILLDAEPPFDGRTLPPTSVPLKLGCFDLLVPQDAECDRCFGIRFENGINGTGKVPIFNLVATEFNSYLAKTFNCEVCVVPVPKFRRGDCNFDTQIDVADPAAVVSVLFGIGAWRLGPPCVDACDVNDDGRIDLADALALLHYTFNISDVVIPAPGFARPGVDPTEDKLDCEVNPCP